MYNYVILKKIYEILKKCLQFVEKYDIIIVSNIRKVGTCYVTSLKYTFGGA